MYCWDESKSARNKEKHGISFEEARDHIFEKNKLLAIGVPYRNNLIRIISVRRTRREEEGQAKRKGI